ncbi:TonB-dependent receptor [marine gamma proteobacterium HTCC2207]|jgi:iron complex outermembrane receptor protein|uniref:TonB-dependent receptor n=1 Tax=gamma proteobacterium HTCC2207 TaxID=314287 RepID=Q1YPG5_9GAMM|nr:TonB-dependent receptor [marine gamma proteobacterium HTCC2207] [gamma proteobacterium HTCC2207]MBT5105887.1 TonB-dependent receptor [Porticoccaceae bacterium]MBT6115288.1 TonB-dependent receptor [Porticoccaceae bacterium]MBT6593222.1 TonB-dependent receptor [Porticoccaceae bacterium]MDG1080153.1 TonB-dependent receptor [Porticoccaceae bacterium]
MKAINSRNVMAMAIMASLATTSVAEITIEEIVVSARKRAENLQEVPIAVTAFTEAQIESAGIQRPADFISLMPNVTMVDSANVGDTQVSIRGIVSTRDAESTFAYVVDGVLVTNPNGFNEELMDVSQIEVLKGPQGALYGRNAVAGAIIVTTNRPDEEFEGKVKVGAGNNGSKNASLTLSGGLAEGVLGRVSVSQRETDGHYSNALTGASSVDFLEDTTVRGRVIWDVNEELSLDFRGGMSEVSGGAINFNAVFAIPAFAAGFGPTFFKDVNEHEFIFSNNVPGENEQETTEFSIKADWDRDGVDVTAILSYSDLEEYLLSDGTSATFYGYELTDACQADRATLNNAPTAFGGADRSDLFGDFFGPFGVFPGNGGADPDFTGIYGPYTPTACDGYQYQERNQSDTSLEIRLTSDDDADISWIAGVYAAEIEREVVVAYGADTGNGFLRQGYVGPTGPNPTDLMFSDQFDTSVMAIFGQLEFDISDDMEIAVAGRFDREERDVRNQVPNEAGSGLNINSSGSINPAFASNPNGIPKRSATFSQFQPKVTWSWNAAEDLNLYASWGVGFRSGGFNSIGSEALLDLWYGDTCPSFVPSCGDPGVAVDANLSVQDEYKKEVSTSFEFGSKMEFFDNRLRVNAAVFQTEVEDNQFFEFFAGPFGLMRVVTTIDELEIQGFEMDFNAVVTENLSVFGGAGFLDSEIIQNDHRPLSEGNEAPQSPDRTYNLGAQFEMAVSSGVEMTARLDWQYVGEMAFHTLQGEATPTIWQVFNGPGLTQDMSKAKRDAYDTLNARISFDAENWGVTIWGRNVTDEKYLEEIIPAPEFGGSFIHPGAKDSYGIDFNYRF